MNFIKMALNEKPEIDLLFASFLKKKYFHVNSSTCDNSTAYGIKSVKVVVCIGKLT